MSGLTADARTLIDHARVEAQQHRFTYNEPMPVESLTQSLCDLALRFGEDDDDEGGGMVRYISFSSIIQRYIKESVLSFRFRMAYCKFTVHLALIAESPVWCCAPRGGVG